MKSTTTSGLKKELEDSGYRLVHGYKMVKRKPKKKSAAKAAPPKKKTAAKKRPAAKTPVRKPKPAVLKKSRTVKKSQQTATHPAFKVGDKLIAGNEPFKPAKHTGTATVKKIFRGSFYSEESFAASGNEIVVVVELAGRRRECSPVKTRTGNRWYLNAENSSTDLFFWK